MKTAYINTTVLTMNPAQPHAEAFLVENGCFVAVGATEQILAAVGATGAVVDLQGKTVIPGFNDSHIHLLNLAYSRTKINLQGIDSIAEIIAFSKDYIASHPVEEGKWISGCGWNHYAFPENRLLDKGDLDQISTTHPLLFTRVCEHTVVVNSMALTCMGIDDSTPNPEGGEIDRDANGHATGILKETARYLAYAQIPDKGVAEIKKMLSETMDYLLTLGITSVQSDDFETFSSKNWKNVMQAYQELEQEGLLKLRVYEQCLLPSVQRFQAFLDAGYKTGWGSPFFKVGPLKLLLDGSIGPRTASLNAPYSDDPGNSGILVFTPAELETLITMAQKNQMQVVCHGIGDKAMEMVLVSFEQAQQAAPLADRRNGIIHVQITTPAILQEMQRQNIVSYAEPVCVGADMHCVEDRIGKQRMQQAYAYRDMFEMGLHVPLSSDAPVDSVNPFDSAYIAVNRKDLTGYPEGGWYPEQRLTVQQVLAGFTLEGAYASFEEDVKGSIAQGKYADFLVLDQNPLRIDPQALKDVHVLETYVGGNKIVSPSL